MPTADEVADAVWSRVIAAAGGAGPAPAEAWVQYLAAQLNGYGARVERIDEGAHGGWGYGKRIEDIQAKVTALQESVDALAATVAALAA